MKIDELMSKPVWQMTGEELMFLQSHNARPDEASPQPPRKGKRESQIFRFHSEVERMNTFSVNNEQPRLYLSDYFRSIRFCFTAEALEWLSGTTSDDSNTPIANQSLFYDLRQRMRFTAGRDTAFRRPQWVQACAFRFSEIQLAADWNMGRKRVHNLLLTMVRIGLIAVHSSRVASIAAMVCVEGWTNAEGDFIRTPYSHSDNQ